MESRFYRYFLQSFLLALASSLATYFFVWGLDTTHPELGIPNGAGLTLAICIFPIAFLAGMAIAVGRRAGHRRH